MSDNKKTAWPSWSVKWVRASRRAAPPPVRSPGSPASPRPRWRHHRHARAPGREIEEGDAGDHARPEAEVGEKNREVGDAEAAEPASKRRAHDFHPTTEFYTARLWYGRDG